MGSCAIVVKLYYMPNAAILGTNFICPIVTPGAPPVPHAGGAIVKGAPNVMICGRPAARMGDSVLCAGVPPQNDAIMKGSLTVMIGGMPAAYTGGNTALGGIIGMGAQTVMVGM